MALVIGPGITIGGGISVQAGGGAPPSPVTYIQGVDYDGALSVTYNTTGTVFTIRGALWINTAGFNILKSQPSGIVYTVIWQAGPNPPGPGTLTTSSTWADQGGDVYTSSATGIDTTPYNAAITSITFTPA